MRAPPRNDPELPGPELLPVGLDDTLPGYDGNLWYDPLKRWASDLDDWMHKQSLLLVREGDGQAQHTATVLRACEGEDTLPKLPVTSRPTLGQTECT